MAWEPLGFEAAWYSEIEPFPSAVLAHHYPETPNLGDMTKYKEWPDATIDILVGGTPCQSFSVAGLRKGLDDPRGNLMLTFGAIAGKYRPRWLVWENVPGVLSSSDGRDFASFLGLITGQRVTPPTEGWSNSGVLAGYKNAYGVAWRIIDAQFAGVPQRRRRVFVVGHLGDWRLAAAVLFERHSLQGNNAPRREAREKIAGCITARFGRNGGAANDDVDSGRVALCVNPGRGQRMNPDHETMVVHSLRGEGFDASEDGTGRGIPLVAPCLTGNYGKQPDNSDTNAGPMIIPILEIGKGSSSRGQGPNGCGIGKSGDPMYTLQAGAQHAIAFSCKDHGADAGEISPCLRSMNFDKSHANAGGQIAVAFKYGQGSKAGGLGLQEEQSPTLGAAQSGTQLAPALLHRSMVRRLTPRECERLQGFPDDYTLIPWRTYQEAKRKGISYESLLADRGMKLREPAGEECPDGPRYKAIGNSMARPVMEWLGQRIKWVQALCVAHS